jgi:STE24 endopeptidase
MATPADASRYFSPQELERARAYHRPLYVASAASSAVGAGYLAALAFSPAGRWLAAPVDDLPRWAFAASYATLILLAGAVLRLPMSFWRGFVHEHRWGFSTQALPAFLWDWAKGVAVSVALAGAVLLGFVELASALPGAWPAVAGACAAALVVALSFLAPVVLEPLFNRFRPLADEELAADVRALSVRAGVPVRDVLVADASRRTRKENAYVSGLGRTRRVVVFDTLLQRAGPRDVRLVVAHELGHGRAHHVALGTALGAGGAIVAVWYLSLLLRWHPALVAAHASGAADPRIIPFVLLAVVALELWSLPLGAALSRRWEASADRASIELTGDPDGFAEMEHDLAVANLLDLAPSRLVYLLLFTHPTPPERIEAALRRPPIGRS